MEISILQQAKVVLPKMGSTKITTGNVIKSQKKMESVRILSYVQNSLLRE